MLPDDGKPKTEVGSAGVDVRNPEIENPVAVSAPEPVIDDTAVGAELPGIHPNIAEPVGATSSIIPVTTVQDVPAEELAKPETLSDATSTPIEIVPVPEGVQGSIVADIEKAAHPFAAATTLISGNDPAHPTSGAITLDQAIREARDKTGGE